MNHTDATILHVILCPWCKLPWCEHGYCLNIEECPKADDTRCSCYTIYAPGRSYNQQLIGDSRCDGKRKGKRGAA